MKILFVTYTRIPTEKAIGLEVVKMCEAFAKEGLEVELICPQRLTPIKEDTFEYYNIEKNFRIKKLFHLDLIPLDRFLGPFANWFGCLEFSFISFCHMVFTGSLKPDVIFFSNHHFSLFLLSFFSKNVVYEIHDFPRLKSFVHKAYFQRLFKNLKKFVATNSWKKKELERIFGIGDREILVCPNGVDLQDFKIKETKEECRKKLGLPQDKKIVLYTGHLFSWKGVDTLVQASKFLTENIEIYFVGGTEKDIKEFKIQNSKATLRGVPTRSSKIQIIGHRPHSEIAYWQKAADILVLPNTAKEDISKYWTSPMKMFEYMASKRPIVASDLPSIRNILNEKNAVFFEPDNPKSLSLTIKQLLENVNLSEKIAKQAYQDVQQCTWDNRAKHILNFIKSNLYSKK